MLEAFGLWRMLMAGFLVVSLCGAAPVASAAGGSVAVFPYYKVNVTSGSSPVFALNKHQTLTVTLEATTGAPAATGFKFDARMPQHKHGMVTSPKVTKVKDLEYKVEGVRLHMPGLWVIDFVIEHQSGETRISAPVELAPM